MRTSSPDEARQVAAHTVQMLAALRRSTSKSDAKQLADAWFGWAKTNGVCSQIRDHFGDAVGEVMAGFPAGTSHGTRSSPVIRNPAGEDR